MKAFNHYPVDVTASGAVILGPDVVCDGFYRPAKARVQTHMHDDHMDGFQRSKGFQDIIMSKATKELIVTELNEDLPYRSNLYALEFGCPMQVDRNIVTLLPSNHMLGAAQVAVQLPSGDRVGYSGDFQWPLDDVIEVDALVVDSTWGSPRCRRRYSQEEAETRFLELVVASLKRGPIFIKAHRGTVQRALQVLAGNVNCALVGSPRFCKEADIYRSFGYLIDPIISAKDTKFGEVIASGRYIRFYSKGDIMPINPPRGTSITLSAYMTDPDDPVLTFNDRSFRIALSNHADFDGTLEYIRSTGAKFVVADNTRGGHAVELCTAIRTLLNIEANPSTNKWSNDWGI